MLLLSAIAAVFQLVWVNLLVIDPLAGSGDARETSQPQRADSGSKAPSLEPTTVIVFSTVSGAEAVAAGVDESSTTTVAAVLPGDGAGVAASTTTVTVDSPAAGQSDSAGSTTSITTSSTTTTTLPVSEELEVGSEGVLVVLGSAE